MTVYKDRVFFTHRNFLWALDRKTGKPIEGFGDNGRTDLRQGALLAFGRHDGSPFVLWSRTAQLRDLEKANSVPRRQPIPPPRHLVATRWGCKVTPGSPHSPHRESFGVRINDVPLDDTFAEAFPMTAARLIVTAATAEWARVAGGEATGYAASVIGCDAEAGIER